jgi:hypothetical protein
MKHLVLIHGRSQQNLDSIALKQKWVSALKEGMRKSGKDMPVDEDHIQFPYYGDTLTQLCDGKLPDQASKVIVRGGIADDAERQFAASMITEIAKSQGVTDAEATAAMDPNVIHRGVENWPIVLGFLRVLDAIPGINAEAIALATHDVYQYLRQSGVNLVINRGVSQAFTSGDETVVVSHSLGTVVAYNILRDSDANWNISKFVTLGSPLAVTAIKQALAPLNRPSNIGSWFNARDPKDVVALFPLSEDYFPAQPIENKNDVENGSENHHGIEWYLSDPEVASSIHRALL